MEGEITFGYWGTRGRGQPLRLLLVYTGANWKDKCYTSPAEWFEKDKKNIGFSFPNLPYLIEGSFKLTETLAIGRYIANRSEKKDLLGKDLKDKALVDNLLGVYNDIQAAVFDLALGENFEENHPKTIEKIKPKVELLQKFYGDKEFALGYPTVPDFFIAEISYYLKKVSEELYNKAPHLKKVAEAINNLPEVKAYYEKEENRKIFVPPYLKIQPEL